MKPREEGKKEGRDKGREERNRKEEKGKKKKIELFPPGYRRLYSSTKDTKKGGASICGQPR